ncbi:hypothetical protein EB796_007961 [Bugula neritina]|uniref:NAD(+) kinase n=1 Tax=Bugula neritina TaxID=10212 RepID=A0A7J7K724_BUGNE|nr:hypothetical protein EB796_007961 [Bugula neritina]
MVTMSFFTYLYNLSTSRKSKSLYGVNPSTQLGPKAALCQDATLSAVDISFNSCWHALLTYQCYVFTVSTIQDPSSQKLKWCKAPINALVIRKPGDREVDKVYKEVIELLVSKNLRLYVEEKTVDDMELSAQCVSMLTQYNGERDNLSDKVDFIVTLGGDGTLIHASSLFQNSVPPILAFNMGSLGFLTPFDVDGMGSAVDKALAGEMSLTLRTRLKCVIGQKNESDCVPHIKDLENGQTHKSSRLASYSVVNEVVIDRGPSPYLCHIELYVDRRHITSVQGDGLIISTPTGSTAYAAAAGASMMHPSVPAILVVPVCAHSLSFRPIVLPAGVEITIMVSPDARNTAWAAFDGRCRTELKHGDSLRITTSIYPLPSLCKRGQLEDWFGSLAECLNWNVRKSQKALDLELHSNTTTTNSSASLDSLADELTLT